MTRTLSSGKSFCNVEELVLEFAVKKSLLMGLSRITPLAPIEFCINGTSYSAHLNVYLEICRI